MAILRVNAGIAFRSRWPSSSQRRESIQHSTTQAPTAQAEEKVGQTQESNSLLALNQAASMSAKGHIAVNSDGQDAQWLNIVWTLTPATTVGRALVSATERLRDVGIDTPQLDAQVILAYVLKRARSWLFAHHDHKLSAEEAEAYTDLIIRRSHHEPVAYLTRCKEFYGVEFYVDSRVLIPRPETELLVDAVLNQIEMFSEEMAIGEHIHMLDVGTGCGAIAVAVATNCPELKVYATDVSPDAIAVARENIKRLDKRLQITLLEGDLLSPLANKVDLNRVDIIAANLPYINTTDYGTLEPDVRDFEPKLALEAGPDGLDAIHRLLIQAPGVLKRGGVIFLEIGSDQGAAVLDLIQELMPNAAFVNLRQDYNGRDRLVTIVP
ncbi:MAG: peptide chain release factor N(5)-glutamine methyltransferase [Caldilineaceae bacterium]|nr:peptide chain release factor N(5)-glutamine methyltransferase [Caldilineaceae bacterium]